MDWSLHLSWFTCVFSIASKHHVIESAEARSTASRFCFVMSHLLAVCSYCTEMVNKQREMIVLNRQGTQQQRPESPTVTTPGMRGNTRYINTTRSTSSFEVHLHLMHAISYEDVPLVEFMWIHSHAPWSYHWWCRSVLLCPLSVDCYYFPLFVYSTQAL